MNPKMIDKEARRRSILAAAATVFSKYGYQRATIDQIAEVAGVAKGSVYLSFASKEDLFYALFDDSLRSDLFTPLSQPEAESRGTLATVEELLLRTAEMIEQDDTLIPLTLEFWSVCGVEETRERFGNKYAELFIEFRTMLLALLQEGQARGEIAPRAPLEAIASCLIAVIDGLLIQQWTVPGVRTSTTLRQALPFFLQSLKGENHE